MIDDKIKQDVIRSIRSEYTSYWKDSAAQIPFFEIRVSLKTIMTVSKRFDLTLDDLYHILEGIELPFK